MQKLALEIDKTHSRILKGYKKYGFKNQKEMLDKAIESYEVEKLIPELEKSADIYLELLSIDDDIMQLKSMHTSGFPE
ncbi:MAG: hypothetical protein HW421_2345 [Ignavibacteria bacterium]|nr:hypothetical protein [Ignavibacteria bacterium]